MGGKGEGGNVLFCHNRNRLDLPAPAEHPACKVDSRCSLTRLSHIKLRCDKCLAPDLKHLLTTSRGTQDKGNNCAGRKGHRQGEEA